MARSAISIVLAGDLVLDEPDAPHWLAGIAPAVQGADLAVGHLEVPHTARGDELKGDVPAPGAPPMLLATGDADSTVLPLNTESLAARLRAVDNPVRTVTYPGLGHREIIGAFSSGLRFLAPVRRDVLRFVAETTA